MRISLSWLNDFVDLNDQSPEALAKLFTSTTAEVEDVLFIDRHLKECLAVTVASVIPHPRDSDLSIATVSLGHDIRREVVCGAPNLRVGMKTILAPVGVKLSSGVVEEKDVKGVHSQGMLVSQYELGVGGDHSGIWEVSAETPDGASVSSLFPDEQVVMEVDNKSITHRPDLWGHLGIGRECAAILRRPFNDPFGNAWLTRMSALTPRHRGPIHVRLDGQSSCVCYCGLSIENVVVGPSPLWMQRRLIAAGLRPINNLVDIGNYVMVEIGGPLHMFDQAMIRGKEIKVRRLGESADLNLLDGSTAKLQVGDTVVCDAQGPLVVGGIIGGQASGIQDTTRSVFIEAANWVPSEIRRLSTRLGVRTDSSARFEKGLDPQRVNVTVLRAAELVLDLCPGAKIQGALEYAGPPAASFPTKKISTSTAYITSALGHEMTQGDACEVLERLGFEVQAEGAALHVTVPTFRGTRDFEFEADLAEEIGRVVGYDNIAPLSPLGSIAPVRPSKMLRMQRLTRDVLVLRGKALEITTYPMIGAELLAQAGWPEASESLILANPISNERDRMRPSLVPSLLDACALNHKHYETFRFFEIGRSYFAGDGDFAREETHLGAVFCSQESDQTIQLADCVEGMLKRLQIPYEITSSAAQALIPTAWRGAYPEQLLTFQNQGNECAVVTRVHPTLLREFKIHAHVGIAVVNLTALEPIAFSKAAQYRPLPKYPTAGHDFTVVASRDRSVSEIVAVVERLQVEQIRQTKVVSVFQLPADLKSVTLRIVFGSDKATLAGDEIERLSQVVVEALRVNGYPLKA